MGAQKLHTNGKAAGSQGSVCVLDTFAAFNNF